MDIIGIKYNEPNKYGDFNWMINQSEYENVLFIFNDNEEYHYSCRQGRENAIIRKYNRHNKTLKKPHSAGIPTGTLKYKGYRLLDNRTKQIINSAVNEIIELINKYKYNRIYYSIDDTGKLGTNIFTVNKDVIYYIDDKIKNLKNIN